MVDFSGLNSEDDEEKDFIGRSCYEFNMTLDDFLDDTACVHCRKFMTLQCEHIDDFIDEDD